VAEPPSLAQRLAERWPAIRVDPDALAEALGERGIAHASPFAPDVAFVVAVVARDPVALALFESQIVPDIRGALVRFGRDADFVDEALQRVRMKLLVADGTPRIAEYRGRGALAAWVQIVAIREALMMQRGARREVGDDALERIAITEPVLALSKQVHKAAFSAAFHAAFAELGDRERTLLRLCFVEGLGSEEIARLYRIHRVTAFRWLRDARDALLDGTRTRFLASVDVPASQIDSLMRSLAGSLSVPW
jgi:RNA polymerase sigma-70 factor, ECF subfamily